MDQYWDFVKVFLIPGVALSLGLFLLVCCCKRIPCFNHSDRLPVEPQRSIYVIPIPVNDEQDFDQDPEESYAPPAYGSIDPPPPYFERKFSIPDEEPPAYSEIS